jgi:carbonic anhydrase/acetyltransferase-like protein (isoleucine patch superfamily)
MTLRTFEQYTPKISSSAWVDETAVVIGNVNLGDEASIWPGAVVRGDIHNISIGQFTNIQDNSVIHVTHAGEFNPEGYPTLIGDHVTVGHKVILHGCTIHNYSLIGMGSIVLDGAVIEERVLLGAGSLVPPGKTLESGYLWVGSPARRIRKLTDKEYEHITYSARYYAKLKNRHVGGG